MSNSHIAVTPELASYIRNVSLREPPILKRLREETAQLSEARMQISAEQGQFMQMLVQLLGAVNTLEIGVFTGYSSLCTALALPAEGKIVACDINKGWTSIASRYWAEAGVAQKIDLRLAPAAQTLDGLIAEGRQGSFDFAFIDADKQNYGAYYERALLLLRRGGIVALDNVLWHGSVADASVQDEATEAIRRVNEALHQDERVSISMLPVGDGLTLAMKR